MSKIKKILFIGPYRQDDGWGHASRNFLKSLSMTAHNITAAPVYLNSQKQYRRFEDDYILSAESNRAENYDITIQNCLPSMFRRYSGTKNIGLAFFESSVDNCPWKYSISLMDSMWISSTFEKNIIKNIIDSISIIPVPSAPYKKLIEYNSLIDKSRGDFIFYFIGENIERKNIPALLKAFHLEFKPYEQVQLVLKVNNVGKSDNETFSIMKDTINSIKRELGLYKDYRMYKSEFLLTSFLPEEDMIGLHRDCDCFVMPSSGEGFCIPAFDAVNNGSLVIANENCSIKDYVHDQKNGYLVKSTKSPALSSNRPLPYLYNGRDYWYEISIADLRRSMRTAFENQDIGQTNYSRKNILQNYSFEKVANDMNEAIEAL